MTPPIPLFYLVSGVLIFNYLLERFLDYLNSRCWSEDLPKELEGIYEQERYKKSQQYTRTKQRFSLIVDSLTFLVIMLVLIFGGVAFLDQWVREYTGNIVVIGLLFFGSLGALSFILSLPFDIYQTFVIEEKFGFNRTTIRTFILDKIKGILLTAIIGGGLLALIITIYNATGNYFWLLTWGVITFFQVFFTMFYSDLIVPLFNKQKPLEEGPLRSSIEAFSTSEGFRLKNIFVLDGSKRSGKANAYFSGLGKKKRIVLFDTLIENHSTEELVAVLAHEIGHYKKKHTLQGMILSVIQTGLMLFILSLFIRKDSSLAQTLCQSLSGFSGLTVEPGFHMGILAFGILYTPLSIVLGLFMNLLSRKNEYEADRYAGEKYDPEKLAEALKKLSVNNLSNLTPHPVYVLFYYSHPTLLQRVTALKEIEIRDHASASQQKQ